MSVSVTFSSVKSALAIVAAALLWQQPSALHNLLTRASSDFPGQAIPAREPPPFDRDRLMPTDSDLRARGRHASDVSFSSRP